MRVEDRGDDLYTPFTMTNNGANPVTVHWTEYFTPNGLDGV